MNEIFQLRNEHPHKLRQNSQFWQNYQFSRPVVKSLYHVPKSFSYLEQKVWDILPNIYKNMDRLGKFEKAVKNGNLRIVFVESVRSIL